MRTSITRLFAGALALCSLLLGLTAHAGATPTITLSGLPGATVPGYTITVLARVAGGSGTPTGNVAFIVYDTSTGGFAPACGNAPINSGGDIACSFAAPSNGSYNLSVEYGGDATYDFTITQFPFTTQQATPTISLSGLPASTVPSATINVLAHLDSTSPVGRPSGNVQFVIRNLDTGGFAPACARSPVNSNADIACSFSAPGNGNYSLDVEYQGDTANAAQTTGFGFATQQATPSVSLSGLPANTVPSATITVLAHLDSTSPVGRPTGNVQFVVRNLATGGFFFACSSGPVNSNADIGCSFGAPATGNYRLDVEYNGDPANTAVTQGFGFTTSQVTPAISLTGLPASTVPTATINVLAHLDSASPIGRPTGNVSFVVRSVATGVPSTVCGASPVNSNADIGCSFGAPSSGQYRLEVQYGGDAANEPVLQTFIFNTAQATPTITLSGVPGRVTPGTTITAFAHLDSTSPVGRPTGNAAFIVRDLGTGVPTTVCGSSPVNGNADIACTFGAAAAGNYRLDVEYYGDAANAAVTAQFPFVVGSRTPTISQTGAPSGTVLAGSTYTVNANVIGSPTPTGQLEFNIHDSSGNFFTNRCVANLDGGGSASCPVATPGAGSWQLHLKYNGDANFDPVETSYAFAVSSAPVVTNTNDSGTGSLRDAIAYVNANCSGQEITFGIAGAGPHMIRPASALPAITCPGVAINGYSQPGTAANSHAQHSNAVILVELNGGSIPAANGLEIAAAGISVSGLSITGFASGTGIYVTAPIGSRGIHVWGNFIGLAPDGVTANGNSFGIATDGTGLSIGGQSIAPHAERNVISGNYYGVALRSGDATVIEDNLIGTNAGGMRALGNYVGIYSVTTHTQVVYNVLSGNAAGGVGLQLVGASDSVIIGNLVGLSADGLSPVPNTTGMQINDAPSTLIGVPGTPNIVGGNTANGITIVGSSVTIRGNTIGAPVGNGGDGIHVDSSTGIIGGLNPGEGNVITNNVHGIVIPGGTVEISSNQIYGNASLGINLLDDGASTVAPNDACDADGGGNGLANYPVLTSVTLGTTNITVSGTHNTTASTRFRLEFFASPAAENAANRSGQVFLGYDTVTTDGTCNVSFTLTIPNTAPAGYVITATSTDPSGNTSPFSNGVTAAAAVPTPAITAIRPNIGSVAGGAAIELEGTDLDVVSNVTIGGLAAFINRQTRTSMTVTLPAHAAGPADVYARNFDASGSTTITNGFTYVNDDDAARDFAIFMPSPRWSYGYASSRGGAFTLLPTYNRASVDQWTLGGSVPAVSHNPFASTVVTAGTNDMAPGSLALHPSGSSVNAVVRWTAPAAGAYHVAGAFTGRDFSYPTTTDVAVLKNNNAAAPLFADTVFEYNTPHSFAFDVAMNAGETLEFTVGPGNGDFFGDLTQLSANVVAIAPAAGLSLSTTAIDYGAVLAGTSAVRTVTLLNNGTAPTNISSIALSPPAYFIASSTCPATLPVGASCSLDIQFNPASAGSYPGSLDITSDAAPGIHSVSLAGLAATAPTISISTFATRTPGQVTTLGIFISNPSGNTVTYSGFSVTLPYPAGFVHDTSRALQTSCSSGVFTTGSPVDGIGAAGGSDQPGTGCTVVSSQLFAPTTPGVYTFTIPAGGFTLTSPFPYSNPAPITATVTVSPAPAPGVSLSPPSLTFPAQAIGTTSAPQPVALTNTGTAPLTISSISIGPDFTVSVCSSPLAAGASCTMNVTFHPTAAGTVSSALTLVTNAAGSPHSVALSGVGQAPAAPGVSLTPPSLVFASRTVATTSAPQTVTLANSGTATLNIRSMAITGDFAFASTCPTALAAGATCLIDVKFTPLVEGSRLGSLDISSDAAGSPHSVSLSGNAVSASAPVATLSTPALDFSVQPVNADSAPLAVTVTNTGTATLTFGAVNITGDYRLDALAAGASPPACPVNLAPGASCQFAVIFHPVAPNLRSGVLSISTNAGSPSTVSLAGTGLAPAVPQLVVPSALDFGHQPVGTRSAGRAVRLENKSASLATITDLSATGDFSVSDTCTTIAAGATCSPLVFFQPSAVGTRGGTLTVRTLRDAQPYLVTLTGIGDVNTLPVLETSATGLGFGNVFIGSATTMRVTLRSTGDVPVAIDEIRPAGPFLVQGGCATIAAHSTCDMDIVFMPNRPGTATGEIEIRSNAAGNPHRIGLSGVGCFVPSPSRARFGLLLCGP
jgi:hypothetical protein